MYVAANDIQIFANSLLTGYGVRESVAMHVSAGLVQASVRGVDSHGVRLLPHYVRALKAGRLNPSPNFKFEQTGASTGTLDGDDTFGHASGAEGMGNAVRMARESGMASVAVHNSSHFGSAAYFALMAADQGMLGLSFTHADALMLSSGASRPFFGTNPICFAAPCRDEDPFCLDMATTTVTWNKLLKESAESDTVPMGWGVDEKGQDTQDPTQIRALHPIGGYKGFGLGMMVDILCGVLTGMPYGRNISKMYADPIGQKRRLGHFFMAIDIGRFLPIEQFQEQMQELMMAVRAEPPSEESGAVLVPGDPEKSAMAHRKENGIPLTKIELGEFMQLAQDSSLEFPEVREKTSQQ